MSYEESDWFKTRNRKIERANGGHVMGKPEAKMMRKIQAETGLTKEEVREHKKYRKLLSNTQAPSIPHWKILADTENVEFTPRDRFMEQAMFWTKDQEMCERLYKRSVGGLTDGKRPKNFHYATLGLCRHGLVLEAIDQSTDGMFTFNPIKREVGFMYEANLSTFLLSYQP